MTEDIYIEEYWEDSTKVFLQYKGREIKMQVNVCRDCSADYRFHSPYDGQVYASIGDMLSPMAGNIPKEDWSIYCDMEEIFEEYAYDNLYPASYGDIHDLEDWLPPVVVEDAEDEPIPEWISIEDVEDYEQELII